MSYKTPLATNNQTIQWFPYLAVFKFIYIITSVMHSFWLVLTYDLLEDRHIDDVIIKTFFNSLLYKTNRFQVAMRLFSNRSQRTSKCGKNVSDTLSCASCATFLYLPHFDVLCHLLLNRCTATWNLFIKYTTAVISLSYCILLLFVCISFIEMQQKVHQPLVIEDVISCHQDLKVLLPELW